MEAGDEVRVIDLKDYPACFNLSHGMVGTIESINTKGLYVAWVVFDDKFEASQKKKGWNRKGCPLAVSRLELL